MGWSIAGNNGPSFFDQTLLTLFLTSEIQISSIHFYKHYKLIQLKAANCSKMLPLFLKWCSLMSYNIKLLTDLISQFGLSVRLEWICFDNIFFATLIMLPKYISK
jgi:hypothetical protein